MEHKKLFLPSAVGYSIWSINALSFPPPPSSSRKLTWQLKLSPGHSPRSVPNQLQINPQIWFAEVNSRTFTELRVKKPHPGSRRVNRVGTFGVPIRKTTGSNHRFKRDPDRPGIDQIRDD